MTRVLRLFLVLLSRSRLALVGAALVTTGVLADLILLGASLLMPTANPYLGIFAFLVFPGLAAAGLLLIPLGLLRAARVAGGGQVNLESLRQLPGRIDRPALWRLLTLIALLTLINLLGAGVIGFQGYQYMESTEFCGRVCHQVMAPEYATYLRSPHSEVPCVECHIGPGAGWFVKSKLSGAYQLIAVTLDSYPRPIPAPVENLRPARETCEHCHRPQLFHGNLLKVIDRHAPDETNTLRHTVLNLKVGGGEELGRPPTGIHWHVSRAMELSYVAADRERQQILEVTVRQQDGTSRTWRRTDLPSTPHAPRPSRVMDCVDCHNRPTHIYLPPEKALEERFAAGEISTAIPWIKREALAVLSADYGSLAEAQQGIRALSTTYQSKYPEAWQSRRPEIEQAVAALERTWQSFVFPGMNVRWNTYPSHLGHRGDDGGCFRCHNNSLRQADGTPVRNDCELCHHTLALDQVDPEVFRCLHSSKSVELF